MLNPRLDLQRSPILNDCNKREIVLNSREYSLKRDMVFTIIFGVLKIQTCVSQQYGSWKGIETWKYNAGLLCDASHRLAVQRELHVECFFACVHM